MNRKIKVILVDDLQSFIDGVKMCLQLNNIDVIGQALNGKELMELLIDKRLRPDVILLDIDMPVMDGTKALIKVKEFDPEIKVIMLTLYKDDTLVNNLKKHGANCFLSKDVSIDIIIENILELFKNDRYTNIPKKLVVLFTRAELEILLLLAKRKTTNEIAKIRGKSVKSIEAHKKRMYEKADVDNAVDFDNFCSRRGLFFIEN